MDLRKKPSRLGKRFGRSTVRLHRGCSAMGMEVGSRVSSGVGQRPAGERESRISGSTTYATPARPGLCRQVCRWPRYETFSATALFAWRNATHTWRRRMSEQRSRSWRERLARKRPQRGAASHDLVTLDW